MYFFTASLSFSFLQWEKHLTTYDLKCFCVSSLIFCEIGPSKSVGAGGSGGTGGTGGGGGDEYFTLCGCDC